MYAFDIERPTRLADAVKLLSDSTEATMLGGGQTLIPSLKQRLAAPDRLVCLSGIREIRGICTADDGALCIGGGTCHADVAAGAGAYPALASLAANIGDPAVRNRGTIGGSVANNDPSACYPTPTARLRRSKPPEPRLRRRLRPCAVVAEGADAAVVPQRDRRETGE